MSPHTAKELAEDGIVWFFDSFGFDVEGGEVPLEFVRKILGGGKIFLYVNLSGGE